LKGQAIELRTRRIIFTILPMMAMMYGTGKELMAQTNTGLPLAAQPSEVNHQFVQVNGIRMHIAEQGQGPLVLLLHGFPELWYSSRHLLPVLAAAGYRAVAPDMRGYGETDAPSRIEDYSQLKIVGDIVGLVHALGYEQAVVSGHDWGAAAAFNSANLRPDMFRAVVLLSIPYAVRAEGGIKPSEANRQRTPQGMQFYQTYYQEPGVAEKVLDADPKRTLRMWLYSSSGLIPPEDRARYTFGMNETALDGRKEPKQLPSWLKTEDLDYYAKEFSRTGFRGALNWYRAQDVYWEATPFLAGRKLQQPTLFIGGADDPWIDQVGRPLVESMETSVPNLWKKVLLSGVGHLIEQEAPAEVNRLIIEFLHSCGLGRGIRKGSQVNPAVTIHSGTPSTRIRLRLSAVSRTSRANAYSGERYHARACSRFGNSTITIMFGFHDPSSTCTSPKRARYRPP
jgi:pimeloyl-ACP methyl ester carboxylesterase